MEIGKLNKRITINKISRVASGTGWTETITKVKDTWAHVRPISHGETLSFGLELGQRNIEFTIRYDGELDQTNQIVFGSRTFRVKSVINTDEANREVKILAVERTD